MEFRMMLYEFIYAVYNNSVMDFFRAAKPVRIIPFHDFYRFIEIVFKYCDNKIPCYDEFKITFPCKWAVIF